ncbi:MAG: UDP-N-acetylmuramate--L-alanine ligase [Candidatus Latescibacterota bacterium]
MSGALFDRYDRVHLVGIGGVGMEGLARFLAQMGCRVSGSDRSSSRALEGLQRDGFAVSVGHRAEQAQGSELVVYSVAVPAQNEELTEARRLGLPLVRRAELLGELSRTRFTVAVAGSHGKTTTSSMVAGILRRAGLDPSVLVGGCRDGRAEGVLGRGPHFVVEADEYDRSFLRLFPTVAVVTSVDAEHLDCYGSLAGVEEAFNQFLARLPFYGPCLLAGDGRIGEAVGREPGRPVRRWGLGPHNDYRAVAVELGDWGSRCVVERDGASLGGLELSVPGEHNLRNALAATAAADALGIDFGFISAGLAEYKGVARRFERRGEVHGVLVIDDYAHHPAELAAALATARATGRRVVAAFQPHLYSRTRDLGDDFARELAAADVVYLVPVYASREEPIPGVGSDAIAASMRRQSGTPAHCLAERGELLDRLAREARPGDLVLTLGAGDLDEVAGALVERLQATG